MDHNKLWKILQELGIPDHLNCLLRNLYAGQEATVRTGHGTIDWFHNRKRSMLRLYIVTLLNFRYMKDIKEGKKEVHVFTDRFFRKIN